MSRKCMAEQTLYTLSPNSLLESLTHATPVDLADIKVFFSGKNSLQPSTPLGDYKTARRTIGSNGLPLSSRFRISYSPVKNTAFFWKIEVQSMVFPPDLK